MRTWTRDKAAEEGEPRSYRYYRADDGWVAQRVGTGSATNPRYWMVARSEDHYWCFDGATLAEVQRWVDANAAENFDALLVPKKKVWQR